MKKYFEVALILFLLFSNKIVLSQNKFDNEIVSILNTQATSWNKGDLEGFMQTYWKNDSLVFIGKKGATYGWDNTLNNYKKSYPSATAMGKLRFDILQVKQLSKEFTWVIGRWFLKGKEGDLNGSFTLLLKKIRGKWLIVADHSS